jgi:hypothetical protein
MAVMLIGTVWTDSGRRSAVTTTSSTASEGGEAIAVDTVWAEATALPKDASPNPPHKIDDKNNFRLELSRQFKILSRRIDISPRC